MGNLAANIKELSLLEDAPLKVTTLLQGGPAIVISTTYNKIFVNEWLHRFTSLQRFEVDLCCEAPLPQGLLSLPGNLSSLSIQSKTL